MMEPHVTSALWQMMGCTGSARLQADHGCRVLFDAPCGQAGIAGQYQFHFKYMPAGGRQDGVHSCCFVTEGVNTWKAFRLASRSSAAKVDLPMAMCTLPALSALYSTLPPLKSLTACAAAKASCNHDRLLRSCKSDKSAPSAPAWLALAAGVRMPGR